MASTLSADLARAGVAVVSGLARGIDAASHRGALEAGGLSFAVLAASPETPYPPESADLHRQLVECGAVCAEYPAGTPIRRGLFVRRNRIVAGLCRGVIVVEAGRRSGALSTAREAVRAGRFLAAVPGDVTRENALGCLELLRTGAVPVGDAGDVLALMARPASRPPRRRSGRRRVEREQLPSGLGESGSTIEELALRSGRSATDVQAELTKLELAGAVRRDAAGRYRR
jgi:DNA processing protein